VKARLNAEHLTGGILEREDPRSRSCEQRAVDVPEDDPDHASPSLRMHRVDDALARQAPDSGTMMRCPSAYGVVTRAVRNLPGSVAARLSGLQPTS
jgi:hypothetical protein